MRYEHAQRGELQAALTISDRSVPNMPALGVSTPAITSELGGICRVIFTNRSTVEEFDSQHEKFRNGREYIIPLERRNQAER